MRIVDQIQRRADIEHFIHWPPKYAEVGLSILRQEVYNRIVSGRSSEYRILIILLADLIEPALPQWKVTPVKAEEFMKELRWDVFCAVNHV